jgi:hypothetical protein
MRYIKTRYVLFITAALTVLVSYCSFDNPQTSGGTTTETTNGCVIGSLKTIDGSPANQTIVKLIKSHYNPVKDGPVPDSLIDTTGDAGEFAFHVAGGGIFNIEGVQRSSQEGILIPGVMVKDSDTTIISSGTIRKTGSIKILLPQNRDTAQAYIYIRGTTICAMLNDTTRFALIGSVPAGIIPSVYYAVANRTASQETIADSVTVAPGVTTIIGYQMGKHSAKIVFNTTASGADIAGTVTNFPALIRLREDNFDFAQAKADGGDLRFAKSNGAPLPYEIERWDLSVRQAEVWVKIDSVYGNDSTKFIIMFWGDSAAAGISNGESVFDTADGFSGVWHLSGAGNKTALDATYHHYDGTPSDTAPQTTEGVIGSALQFDGNVNGLVMKNTATSPLNFPRPGTYTFSAWVSIDTVFEEDEFIAGKGHYQYALRIKGSKSTPAAMFALHEYYHNPVYGTDMKYAPVVMQQWKHITGIRTKDKSYLYIDGECVDSTGMVIPIAISPADSTDFSIGRCGAPVNGNNYLPFKGMIDEVRIAKVAFSADWVKLSFMNQQSNDKLVKLIK